MKKIFIVACMMLVQGISMAQTPGNALQFDGLNDYVSAPLPTLFSNTAANDFTVEAWINPQFSNSPARVFFAQSSASQFVSIMLSSANVVYVYVYNGSANGFKIISSLPAGQWSHVAATWDASASQLLIYVNGAPEPTTGGGSSSTGSNNSMAIGGKTDGTQTFIGSMDELRIWDYARSACEVLTAMSSEFTTMPSGLIAYYNFNQGVPGALNTTVTTLIDQAGSYTGVLNNFSLNGGSVSNWVASGAGITLVNQSGTSYNISLNDSICLGDSYIFGSQTLTLPGTYTDSLTSAVGCDSIVTLTLSVTVVDTGVTAGPGNILTANAMTAFYQWLNCDSGYAAIANATNQQFTPTANGNYAVRISQNSCIDTSACFAITSVNVKENGYPGVPRLYPNPAGDFVHVELWDSFATVELSLTDLQGRAVYSRTIVDGGTAELALPFSRGLYLVVLRREGEKETVLRLVKQ